MADNDKTVTSVIDADIPATQKIKELGDVSAQAAVKVDSLGDVIAEAEAKAGQTAGMKAQAEAHKQVGAAAEEAAKKARTSSQIMQEANSKAEAQARTTVNNRSGFVPSNMDKALSASLPAYAEFIKLQQMASRLDRAETLSAEQKTRALERLYAQYETGSEVMRRAGMERAALDKLDDATAKKALAAAEALDAEAKANDRLNTSRKSAGGNFGPSAEYLGQSRLASLSPDYAKDQRMNALSQERVATEKALADAIASGAIPAAKAGEVQKQLADHYTKAEEKAAKMNGTIHLSNNAYLQLTASARNTFDSLAAGLPISQIMITQGAQVVSALASEGSFMRALIGPVGLATAGFIAFAAAAATIVVHTVNLNAQLRELRSTAMAYGNLSVSAEAAAESVRRIADNSQFSRAEAMDAVKELTKLRGLSGDARVGIEGTAASFATATGAKLPDAAKRMASAFDGTFASIQKLDEEFNFLDAAQLKSIRAMIKVGDVTKASQIALEAFTKQMHAAGEAAEGSASKGFQAMARAWNEALDAMSNSSAMKEIDAFLDRLAKGISASANRTPAQRAGDDVDAARRTLSEKQGTSFLGKDIYNMLGISDDVADARKRLADAEKALADVLEKEARDRAARPDTASLQDEAYRKAVGALDSSSADQLRIARMTNPVARARAEAEIATRNVGNKGMRTDALPGESESPFNAYIGKAGAAAAALAQAEIDKQTAATLRQVRAEKELADATAIGARAVAEARAAAAGREAAVTGGNVAVARSASLAREEYQALGALSTEDKKLDEALQLVNRSREVGIAQATVEMRLQQSVLAGSSSEAKAREKIADIVRKESEEKSRLAKIEQDSLRHQTALLSAQNDNISASERAYRQAEIAADAQFAKTGNEKERADALALAELNRQQANASAGQALRMQMNPDRVRDEQIASLNAMTGISPEDYAAQMEVIRRAHESNTIARLDLENDWASGADRAMRRYVQSVGRAADQTERLMTNAFKGMEDALVDFAMTGELSFEKMAESIIRDLIRIQVQAAITSTMKPLAEAGMGALGGFFKDIFSGGTSSPPVGDFSTGGGTMAAAHGAAFSAGGNVIPFAKGGVVDNLTPFRFGQGGAFSGIMGEAGPEAIVPLTRTPQGDLGVRSMGGGGTQVTVEINNYGTQKEFDVEQQMGAFGPIVRIIARDEAQKAVQGYAKGGGLTNQMRQDYNIRQPAVNRG